MKLFLTGATGFLGSHFLKQALGAGVAVRALRRPGSQPRIPLPSQPEWVEGEMGLACPEWFQGIDVVVHLAAAGVSPQKVTWSRAFQANVADSMRLVEVAAETGISRFLVCGSCMEYGSSASRYERIPPDASLEPSGAYASSKAAFFTAVKAFCSERVCSLVYLRPFHFFGEGQFEGNFWPSLRKAALAGEDFPMTLGEQVRDFIPVEEVAARFLDEANRMAGTASQSMADGEWGMEGTASLSMADGEWRMEGTASQSIADGEWGMEDNQESIIKSQEQVAKIKIANIGTGHPQTLREFAEYWWQYWGAKGKLLFGAISYRENEVMRYVPEVEEERRRLKW